MKYSVGLLFALAAFTSAQSLSDIPQCAQPCITAAIKSSTTCGETDYKCACQNEDKLVAGATSCVISACGADVALNQVLPATQKFCAAILAGGGSSDASSATSTGASTGTPSETSAGQSTETSSPPTSNTDVGVSKTTSDTVTATSVPPTSTTHGGNGTFSTRPPASVSTAGTAVVGPIGSLAVLLLGAAVAL